MIRALRGDNIESDERTYIDYKGWRFRAPFICMACGVEVSVRQWAFGRCCGSCDSGGPTVRLMGLRCFSGPRELIDPKDEYFIPEENFIDPKDRNQYQPIHRHRRAT